MSKTTENTLQQTTLDWFESLGWQTAFGPDISPGEPGTEREEYDQVVLLGRLQTALESIILPSLRDTLLPSLRDTLLPKLLSGELRLPAAALEIAAQAGVPDAEKFVEAACALHADREAGV